MRIENLIFHKLEKYVGEQSSVAYRDEVLPINPQSMQFVEAITNAYNKKSNIFWGFFDDNADSYPFQTMLDDYLQELSPEAFVAFSKRAMEHLQKEIDDTPLATGGYIIFIHFIEDEMDFVICAILQDKHGFTIDPDTLLLKESPQLDIDQLRVASRINATVWKLSNFVNHYVSFLNTSGDVSRYFKSFIGCTENISTGDLTQAAIDATKDHLMSLNLSAAEYNERFETAMNHMMDKAKRKEPITLESLAEVIDEDNPDAFIDLATNENYGVSKSFNGHKSSISASKYHLFKTKDLTIRFHQSMWGRSVHWEPLTQKLIIEVPDKIAFEINDSEFGDNSPGS